MSGHCGVIVVYYTKLSFKAVSAICRVEGWQRSKLAAGVQES